MRKKKCIAMLMTMVMAGSVFAGCNSSGNAGKQNEENEATATISDNADNTINTQETEDTNAEEATETAEIIETAEPQDPSASPESAAGTESQEKDHQLTFTELSNLEFWYGSGVGAWCTVLHVHKDGSFNGQYHDSDMGDTGEGYPNGVYYVSDFKGQFSEPKKIDAYTYSVQITHIEMQEKPGTEEIVDGMLCKYSEPYGLYDAKEILIYLPGASLKDLPEEYRSWVGYSNLEDHTETELPFYGIYNVNAGDGFSSYEAESSTIEEELDAVRKEEEELVQKLQKENITQMEMTEISSQIYQLWDNELNVIWNQLSSTLDSATMEQLKKEEKDWIKYKEAEIKKAGAECEGGSIQPMIENDKGAELTKTRVYELAEYLQ